MSFVAPDWRVESEYPSPDQNTGLSFWAWQFLRRNREYNADWNKYSASLNQMAARVPELWPVVRAATPI